MPQHNNVKPSRRWKDLFQQATNFSVACTEKKYGLWFNLASSSSTERLGGTELYMWMNLILAHPASSHEVLSIFDRALSLLYWAAVTFFAYTTRGIYRVFCCTLGSRKSQIVPYIVHTTMWTWAANLCLKFFQTTLLLIYDQSYWRKVLQLKALQILKIHYGYTIFFQMLPDHCAL